MRSIVPTRGSKFHAIHSIKMEECRMKRRLGFTLIELLVVIAIIAILAAILFPVFAEARRAARQATCISNLKQQGLANHMYAQDYDECLVGAGLRYPHRPLLCLECNNDPNCLNSNYWNGARAWVDWEVPLQPYIKNEQLFIDPEKREWGCYGYAMNTDSSNDDFPGAPTPPGAFIENVNKGIPPVAMAQVNTPAECLFLFDSFDGALEDVAAPGDIPGLNGECGSPDTEAWETMWAFVYFDKAGNRMQEQAEGYGCTSPWRHKHGVSIMWLDGHVKFVPRLNQLSQRHFNIEGQDFPNF